MKEYVLVTGACINTGVAIVKKFLANGYNVIFTGRNSEKTEKALADYKAEFPDAEVIGYAINSLIDENTVDEKAVEEMFSFIKTKGVIKHLVLNAADQGLNQEIFVSPLKDFARVLNVNVVWNYCLITHTALMMKDNGGGSITFVNSNTAYRAIPDRIAYESSKGAQLSMMRGLALDLGKYKIRVNAVLPGMIKTDRWEKNPEFYKNVPSRYTPIGDVAVGEDIADACYYFVTMARNTTGAELVVDGGNSVQLYPIIPDERKN
ncbi:MAG: SDR family oxidoreductase [Clostridia bacterium]|nr:SDR family oxidoreductase [Clostridia bacterium]